MYVGVRYTYYFLKYSQRIIVYRYNIISSCMLHLIPKISRIPSFILCSQSIIIYLLTIYLYEYNFLITLFTIYLENLLKHISINNCMILYRELKGSISFLY